MLNLQNLNEAKNALGRCDISQFIDPNNSFRKFITNLEVIKFRHIDNLKIEFTHPVTVISGSNKIGKTSLLLLIACSHEKFMKIDATTPDTNLREHAWGDVLRFTKHETDETPYSYKMTWRIGTGTNVGEGKRGGAKNSWTGLAKKSRERRQNSRIKDHEVRLIDLDRVGPVRNFSKRLQSKVKSNPAKTMLSDDIRQAFSYVFDLADVNIYHVGEHITKRCYLVESAGNPVYSSYNTASGEDAVLNILVDIFESPENSLILIDELEAGFHPSIQRKLADIIQYIAWRHKKQFIITTHSPTLMSSFPQESRRFIENTNSNYRTVAKISTMAAFSKMDIFSHPLLRIYCEDSLACFLIKKIISKINQNHPAFNKLVNIVTSGPANQVRDDFLTHRRLYDKMLPKIGYCCIFDGDYKDKDGYKEFYDNGDEGVFFLCPYDAPEKFLARAYLERHPNAVLNSFIVHQDHHQFFSEMERLGVASDENDARNQCFSAFTETADYATLEEQLYNFIKNRAIYFSTEVDCME